MEAVKRKSSVPLYIQVKEDLLAKIESGYWSENEIIPTEKELCKKYEVSKITIREALKILVNEGKLVRIPGKGTFVTKQKYDQKLNRYFSFTRWARQNGLHPSTRIMKVELQEADLHIAQHLNIAEGEQVTRIERLRLGDNEPLMLEIIWISEALCPNLHLQDLANTPLNDILTDVYHIPLTRAVESIEPAMADEYMQKLLAMDKKVLVLLVEHTTYSQRGEVVLFATSYYRGDRYKFSIELDSNRKT